MVTTISESINETVNNYSDILIPVTAIPILDILLCCMISSKARWFQLHACVNLIITVIIFNDVKDYFNNLFLAIKDRDSNLDNYFIIVLHCYHCLFFKNLKMLDYFHHFLFVITGVLPSTYLFNNNVTRFITFTGCGVPGIIEYGTLVLVKHNYITTLYQKKINSYMYAFFRSPLAIFNASFIYMGYKYNYFNHENIYILMYILFLTYFNGTFYNKLTIENYIHTYYKKSICKYSV